MKIYFVRKDEDGVSPVIAIILMVAITVVLAGVLYVWVMQLANIDDRDLEFPDIDAKDGKGNVTATESLFAIYCRSRTVDLSKYTIKFEKNGADNLIGAEYIRGCSDYPTLKVTETAQFRMKGGETWDPSIRDGVMLRIIFINRETMTPVWDNKVAVYDK